MIVVDILLDFHRLDEMNGLSRTSKSSRLFSLWFAWDLTNVHRFHVHNSYLREVLAPDSEVVAAAAFLGLSSCEAALFLRSTFGGGSIFLTALPSGVVCIKLNGIEKFL